MAVPATAENVYVPSGTLLVKHISHLATQNSALGDITDAAIYVTDNIITWVGATADLPAELATADSVLDLNIHLVVPGFVNTHHHMYQYATRVVAPDSELFGWLNSLYLAWGRMKADDVYVASKLAMAELILSGCTTSSDHLYIFPNDVTLDVTIQAAAEIGLRFHPTRGAMSRGKSKGGLPPDECVEEEEAILGDMRRVIETFHDPKPLSMCRVGLAPCSPFSVTHDLMLRSARLAREYEKVRLHTHLAENQEDIKYSEANYGCRPGGYIKQVEWDRDDCWFAHCVMLDDEEVKQFSDNGIGVCHCPSSNLRLASGICPVRKLLDNGVQVGLGTDGAASNDHSNLLSEARLALLLQRSKGNVRGLTVREALALASKGGASNLGREDLGEIAPGFAADFVAWRLDGIGASGAVHDPVAALIFNAPGFGNADVSVINGRVVVKDGKLLTTDLQDLVARNNANSARILQGV